LIYVAVDESPIRRPASLLASVIKRIADNLHQRVVTEEKLCCPNDF
jgi:hypothetical protein